MIARVCGLQLLAGVGVRLLEMVGEGKGESFGVHVDVAFPTKAEIIGAYE
jgi:hypothetical protein